MLTYPMVINQVITIIAIAVILRYAKWFKSKQSLVVSFGLISITFTTFKTSNTTHTQFTTLEWFVISFINAIGWHMCFYCKEKRRLVGIMIMILTPMIILGSMF